MTIVHLVKLAVGIEDLEQLVLRRQRAAAGGVSTLWTRQVPKRGAELVAGGSLYWVIRGSIAARQRILAVTAEADEERRQRCRLELDPAVIATRPQPRRAFQGWRYLEPAEAPLDLDVAGGGAAEELPSHLVHELRSLGLL